MNKYRQIKVTPYAILNAIRALEICGVREMVLSQEDNDLILRWDTKNELPLPKSNLINKEEE